MIIHLYEGLLDKVVLLVFTFRVSEDGMHLVVRKINEYHSHVISRVGI